MKYIIVTFLLIASLLQAQNLKPKSIFVSYFGETITHPGLKVGADFSCTGWSKKKIKKNGNQTVIQKNIYLCPSIGFFYHRDYQTGLFIISQLKYSRKKAKKNYLSYAIGAGYMRTFIPNVYVINSTGEIERFHTGYNYFTTNYSVTFGKIFRNKNECLKSIFFTPQLINVLPNYTKSIWYFALEIGVSFDLIKSEI